MKIKDLRSIVGPLIREVKLGSKPLNQVWRERLVEVLLFYINFIINLNYKKYKKVITYTAIVY